MIQRSIVEGWLREVGVEVLSDEVEEAPEDLAWALQFRGGAFSTLVAHRAVEETDLHFQVRISVSDQHRQALHALSADDRDRFLFDLRIALLQQQVGYRLEYEDPERPKTLSAMMFALVAYEPELTKAGFLRRNHRLQNVAQLAVQMIQKLAQFERWP